MNNFRPWALGCALCFACIVGCKGSSNPSTYPVSGQVTLKGKPLPNVAVTFFPTDGRPAAGITDTEGKFTLSTFGAGDGALPGAHKVTVSQPATEVSKPATEAEMTEMDYSVPEDKPLPFAVEYTDPRQTKLTAEVKADGENSFTFDLQE